MIHPDCYREWLHVAALKFIQRVTHSYCKNIDVTMEIWINHQLVGGFKHFLFSVINGIILPIDFHIFQDG